MPAWNGTQIVNSDLAMSYRDQAIRLSLQGKFAESETYWRGALELQPGRPDAALALAKILLSRGERDEAQRVLEGVAGSFQADGLLSRIRLEDDGLLQDAFAALSHERAAAAAIATAPRAAPRTLRQVWPRPPPRRAERPRLRQHP